MKINLKKNWSLNIDPDNPDSIYVGRDSELSHLRAYIINNNSGSILLSGLRGVGKTSFVNKLIIDLTTYYKKKNTKFFPILISASQIGLSEDKLHANLIKLIIRRLFADLQDEKNDDLETLYKKTFCENTVEEKYTESQIDKEANSENSKISFTPNLETIIKGTSTFLGSYLIIANDSPILKGLGALSVYASAFNYSHIKERTKNLMRSRERSAIELYKKDNSIDNLEYDLKYFLLKHRENFKLLFIIDELDKIKNTELVLGFAEFYKNLFTLSNANYLFITDQTIYEKIVNSDKTKETIATLFTHKVFLTDPSYSELKFYFKQIIEKIADENSLFSYNDLNDEFKNNVDLIIDFLLFESRLDYYNLKRIINENITYDNIDPFIDIDLLINENDLNDIKLKSAILRILSTIYEAHKSNNFKNLFKNQNNLDIMFDFIVKHFKQSYSYDINFKNVNIVGQSEKLNDSPESHLLNLLDFLARYKILKYDGNEQPRQYSWTGSIPIKIIENVHGLVKEEEEFINELSILINNINDIDDIKTKNKFGEYDRIFEKHDATDITGVNAFQIFSKYEKYYLKLRKKVPEHIQFDHLIKYKSEIVEVNKTIANNYLLIISNLLKFRLSERSFQIGKIKSNQNLLITLQDLRNRILQINHNIVFSSDFSKQIVIVENFNFSNDIPSTSLKALKEQENSVLFLNFITSDEPDQIEVVFEHESQIGTNKDGSPKFKKQKYRLDKNYKQFRFKTDFRIFNEIFDVIENWL